MVDEIEVEVRALDEQGAMTPPPFVDAMRKLLLASIGAIALSREQTDAFVKRLVERGELAQKDGEKVLGAISERLRPGAVITVAVTAPNTVGRVKRLTIRRSNNPRVQTLCMVPGADNPSKC